MRRQIFVVFAAVIVGISLFQYFGEQNSYAGRGRHFELPEAEPELVFCGETVPIDNEKVNKKYRHELEKRTAWHPTNKYLLNRAERWLPQIEEILIQYDLPTDLKYLAVAESRLINGAESHKGAIGFWQLMPHTAREMGLEVNDEVDQRYDPIKSTVAACRFFRSAYRELGSWIHVVAAYNMGIEGFKRKMNQQNVDSYFDMKLNKETSLYLYKVLAFKALLSNPEQFGYQKGKDYGPKNVRFVKVDSTIDDLRYFALKQGITYTVLQDYNPWIRYHSLTIKDPDRKGYVLKIPRNYSFEFSIDSALVNYEKSMQDSAYYDTIQVTIDATPDTIKNPLQRPTHGPNVGN